jgi:DNA-binding response OmpR family regulator
LVAYLAHHAGRVVPAGELMEQLYGTDDARDANALEALIVRLRRKLGADAIETRRGLGYLMPAAAEDGGA